MVAARSLGTFARSPRVHMTAVLLIACLGAAAEGASIELTLAAMFHEPRVGMFGMSQLDIRATAAERATLHEEARAMYHEAYRLDRGAVALAAIALAGCVLGAWRARHTVRSWPWLSLVGCPLLVGFALNAGSTCRPGMLVVLIVNVAAFAGTVLDLVRRERSPARFLAGAACCLSLVLGYFLFSAALQSSGILGRFLAGNGPC
jgi:hypothetical protein